MTLHIGFIGTGNFAAMHSRLLAGMEDVKVSAFCGTGVEKAERLAAGFPDAGAYADVERMLEDRKLDAVYICVPPMVHGAIERALLQRNIPFFVEKPLGVDLQLSMELSDEIRKSGLITSVGYHFRYLESTQKALKALEGRKLAMAAGFWMGPLPGLPWWRKQEHSGGQFNEQTTHIVDLVRYMMGEAEEVYAAFSNTVTRDRQDDITVPDVGAVTLKMANGTIAAISNTCILPANHRVELDIYTDKGTLEVTRETFIDAAGDETISSANKKNPYAAENEAFLRAVRTGDTAGILSTYEDAVKTHEITDAAIRSADSGKPVKLTLGRTAE